VGWVIKRIRKRTAAIMRERCIQEDGFVKKQRKPHIDRDQQAIAYRGEKP
jgi:hypothetical protein